MTEQKRWRAVASAGLLARCDCGRTPRAYRVRAPHLTWTVICACGERTGYYSGGKRHAVEAWNSSANAQVHGRDGRSVP